MFKLDTPNAIGIAFKCELKHIVIRTAVRLQVEQHQLVMVFNTRLLREFSRKHL